MTFLQPCWSLSKASSTSRSGTRSVSIRSLPLATLDRSWRMASSHISGEAGALSDPAHSMSGSRLNYFAMVRQSWRTPIPRRDAAPPASFLNRHKTFWRPGGISQRSPLRAALVVPRSRPTWLPDSPAARPKTLHVPVHQAESGRTYRRLRLCTFGCGRQKKKRSDNCRQYCSGHQTFLASSSNRRSLVRSFNMR